MLKFMIYAGSSMYPTMPKFGLLIYDSNASYKLDDIIVFLGHDGKRYCHRLMAINTLTHSSGEQRIVFTTKGDAFGQSQFYEINVSCRNILGKVKWWF